jgi:lipoprotein-anchoring transpeptidase ErfK/SrfK
MMNRREFLQKMMLGAGAVMLQPMLTSPIFQNEWPAGELLGRNCTGGMINIRKSPSADSEVIKTIYEDTVLTWNREVIGAAPAGRTSRRWVETPEGYIFAPSFQPVKNIPNSVITELPQTTEGPGMWAEVTVPYVDLNLTNPPARSPWLQAVTMPRLYYSQVVWIDEITTHSSGQVLYRVNEKYGTYGDLFYAAGEAFRPLTEDEISPISPDVEEKKVVVNLAQQTLSCFEDNREVYFCTVSTGAIYNSTGERVEEWGTPVGQHPIWRKLISLHMSGGESGAGWDTVGVPWTSLFVGSGVSLHSTFWHNGYGERLSHGCVNMRPDDAKWTFRWVNPVVSYGTGEITVEMPGGTTVEVVEV